MSKKLSPANESILSAVMGFHRTQLEQAQSKPQDSRYSLTRLINGLAEDCAKRTALYEVECSDRIAAEIGRLPRPGHAFVPVTQGRRDLTAGIAGAGGYLIETEVAPGDV